MPTYNFKNKKTNEVWTEFFTSYNAKQEYLNANPDIQDILCTPSIIGGTSVDSGKLPEGFKDRMRELKKKHPRGKAVDHLI